MVDENLHNVGEKITNWSCIMDEIIGTKDEKLVINSSILKHCTFFECCSWGT